MVSTRQSSNVGSGSEGSPFVSSRPVRSTLMSCDGVTSSCTSNSSWTAPEITRALKVVSTRQSSEGSGTELLHHGPSVSTRPARSTLMSGDGATASCALSSSLPALGTAGTGRGLLDMPPEILENIFANLGYQKISQLRLVCKQLDQVCCTILNSTFQRLQTTMLNMFQTIRSRMPRRESARRSHPLACESDIVETLHMRLTLLQMTFGKHIERKHCCFFAGEILDEVYRILHYIKVTPKLSRPYKITDELFDLSSMAMEYFKEHIEPTLPEISCFGTDFLDFSKPFSANKSYLVLDSPPHEKDESPLLALPPPQQAVDDLEPSVPQSNMVLRKRISKIKQGMKRYNSQLGLMRRDLRHCKSKVGEQQKLLLEYATRLDDNDKKNEETSRKFSTLLQELNKCKTELQFWRSKTVANPLFCQSCGKSVVRVADKDLEALADQEAPLAQGDALLGVGGAPAPPPPFAFQDTAPADEDPFHSLWAADMRAKNGMTSACGSGRCRKPPAAATATSTSATFASSSSSSSSGGCMVEMGVSGVDLASDPSPSPRAAASATKRKASGDEASSDGVGYDTKKLRRSTQSKLRPTKRVAKA